MTMIEKTFDHHTPTTEAVEKIRLLRREFSDLAVKIKALSPASREQSVALTQLETVAMWTIKAVVINDPDSVRENPPEV